MRTLSPYLFAALFIALQPSVSHAAAPAETFVQENIDEGYVILNDGSLSAPERGEKLHALLLRIIDGKRIAVFTLGVYARDASNAQMAEFADAFSDFVAAVLVHDIAGSPGAMLTVTGSVERAPDDVIVNALLHGSPRADAAPLSLTFRVRKNARGDDSIVDVSIEGISMAATQRSDFTAWLRQHHGNIGALVHELRLRARSFREADEAKQIGARFGR